jgi:hypothetical protein
MFVDEGLTHEQLEAVKRWRRIILEVATEEMGHLMAVWNITIAMGGAPRVGRYNFPLDPGYLPAGVVVKLAPFNMATLQHFIYLERPSDSQEPDGEGFAPERAFSRNVDGPRLTPMGLDYDTVGQFYERLSAGLSKMAEVHGESTTMCGDPSLQLSEADVNIPGAKRVICMKTALAAFDAIVTQGEGALKQNTVGLALSKIREPSARNIKNCSLPILVCTGISLQRPIPYCVDRHARKAACGWKIRARLRRSILPTASMD